MFAPNSPLEFGALPYLAAALVAKVDHERPSN